MGKNRVRTIGDESLEEQEKQEAKKKAEQKKVSKKQEQPEEEAKTEGPQTAEEPKSEETSSQPKEKETKAEKKTKKAKFAKQKENLRSQNYLAKVALIDPKTLYTVSEGLKLLDSAHMAKFDETVELHINTNTGGVSGSMTLPNSTGKTTKVAIVDDALLLEIEKGKINFDILVAHPSMMPKLAKVAKILGPKGLMPNPKNGTITPNPEDVAKKYEGGLTNFKTEAKAPIIHLSVGKLSLGADKLGENINEAIKAVKRSNIRDITLKSTMSPAIKLKV